MKFGETNFFWTFESLLGELLLHQSRTLGWEDSATGDSFSEAHPRRGHLQGSLVSVQDRLPPPASQGKERPESTFLVPTGQPALLYLLHQRDRPACVHTHTLTLTPPRLKCLHNEQGGDSSSKLLIMFPFGLSKDTS